MKRETSPVRDDVLGKDVASRSRSSRFTLLYCLAALVLFSFLSYAAVSTKSATVDETAHAVAGYVHLRHGDFRPQPDHPPLWQYVAALRWLAATPPVQDYYGDPALRAALGNIGPQWNWFIVTLFRTPGNDADHLLASSRLMMLLCGVALGAVTALFAYRAAGPLAACVAVTLFSLDPNFLAHAPLVKNDVAIALCTSALAYALYLLGQRLTLLRLLAVALLCAAAVTTKLTGLLTGPLVLLALLVRALQPTPWTVLRRTLATRTQRLLATFSVCLVTAVVTYVAIWAVYLFRFNPSPDPALHINAADMLTAPADSLPARLAIFARDHHLLPEAFLDGVIFTFAHTDRVTYLLGEVSSAGQFSYFPVAFLAKTPLATLATFLLAAVIPFVIRRPSVRPPGHQSPVSSPVWLLTCLALPILVFVSVAVVSRLNIGLRHIFPAYPPLFILASLGLVRIYDHRPKVLKPVVAVLVVGLAAESLVAFPDYIPFFNAAAGGERGGYRLLSDSNLDWGQDLPLVAEWQRRHPGRELYLAYFGSADPAHYGIRYHNLPGGYALGPRPEPVPSSGGVVAVSAMILQDVWLHPRLTAVYEPLRRREPTEVLGGSIYLFDLDAP